MSAKPRHAPGPECPSCSAKILDAHPVLREWWARVKARFPDVHLSWTFRDKATQEMFFRMHKTAANWPKSKHNVMKDGKPWSRAFDVFRLVPGTGPDGKPAMIATFKLAECREIRDFLTAEQAPIVWGAEQNIKVAGMALVDADHFELRRDVA